VLSVHVFDIIYYGSDLLSYLHNEFDPRDVLFDDTSSGQVFPTEPAQVPPWSTLDDGYSIISL
jgi:hypothetical protein